MGLNYKNTVLRPFQQEDARFFSTLRNDFDVQANLLSLPRANTLADVEQWAQRKNADPGVFFVVADTELRPLGFIQAQQIHAVHGHAELGICLAPDVQQQGHGGNACYLLEHYLRDVFNLRKLTLQVRGDNAQAIGFYEKLKYRQVGTLRAHFYFQQQYFDVVIMEKFL